MLAATSLAIAPAASFGQQQSTDVQQTVSTTANADGPYDLLLKGGRVVDPKNNVDTKSDVGIRGGKIAAVGPDLDSGQAKKTVDVDGRLLTPGLIDMHGHLYAGTGEKGSYAGDNSVYPDGFTSRSCVTTIVDAGSSGRRNFYDFKQRIIDRSKTRVLAFLNIVGNGMRGGAYESNVKDMQPKQTAQLAKQFPDTIVGIKTAHYDRPDWIAVDRAVAAGRIADIPAMVDFGTSYPQRPIEELLTKHLRSGDIYAHAYSGLRRELLEDGTLNPGLEAGRKRGVLFEIGHGGGSFSWDVAVQAYKEDFPADMISTDLHVDSMNAGMKDMTNVMSKVLQLGSSLPDVIKQSTSSPAQAIGRTDLGNLSVGAPADVAVLDLQRGEFGLVDSFGKRIDADKKLSCAMTVREGAVVYDLDGLSAEPWKAKKDS